MALRMASDETNVVLNKFSRTITEPPSQGASQAMLYATGLTPETINFPQVINFIILHLLFVGYKHIFLKMKRLEFVLFGSKEILAICIFLTSPHL